MMKMKINDQKQNLHQQLQAQGASKIGGVRQMGGLPNNNAPQDLQQPMHMDGRNNPQGGMMQGM